MSNDNDALISDDRTKEELVKALRELPLELRTTYVMRYVQRKPLAEVAVTLGISQSDATALAIKVIGVLRLRLEGYLNIGSSLEIAHYRATLQKAGVEQSYIDKVTGINLTRGQDQ